MGLVNKKAWFRAVKLPVPLGLRRSYKMLLKPLHVVFEPRFE